MKTEKERNKAGGEWTHFTGDNNGKESAYLALGSPPIGTTHDRPTYRIDSSAYSSEKMRFAGMRSAPGFRVAAGSS